MSDVTLADIRASVRFLGDYQNTRKFPDSEINKLIQKSFGEFWQLVADTHQGHWDTTGNVSTVASAPYVALPVDTWRVQGVDRFDGNEPNEMMQVGISDRNKFGTSTGKPLAYRTTFRGLDLYPTPDAAYTLRVVYTPKAPKLSEDQPRDYFNGWEEYVVEATLFKLDERERRPLADRITALERMTAFVKSGAGERRSQEPEYLPLREMSAIDPFDEGPF